jgi:hypothetical protein
MGRERAEGAKPHGCADCTFVTPVNQGERTASDGVLMRNLCAFAALHEHV